MLTICPQLHHGTIVSVSGLTRKLNGQMGVVQEQQDGTGECRVRLFKRDQDTLIPRENLVIKTSSSGAWGPAAAWLLVGPDKANIIK